MNGSSVVSFWYYRCLMLLFVDPASAEAACTLCSGLGRQECRDTVYPVLGSEPLSDIYERLHSRRLADTTKTGRNVEDMEGTSPGFVGSQTRVSS